MISFTVHLLKKYFLMIDQGIVISSESATEKILPSCGPSSIFNIKAQMETSTKMKSIKHFM